MIELLVVISTIALLASMVLASIQTARNKAQYVATYAQLGEIKKAVLLLHNDTGKMPGGCQLAYTNPDDYYYDTDFYFALNNSSTGLIEKPIANQVSEPDQWQGNPPGPDQCRWSETEVAQWNGPYISPNTPDDPWKNKYIIHYTTAKGDAFAGRTRNCPEQWFFDASYRNAIIDFFSPPAFDRSKWHEGWAVASRGDRPFWNNLHCRMLLQSINP